MEDTGIFGLPCSAEEAGVVLLPVPWEVTTSYRPGTARGPAAILEASRQVDLYDVETGRPYRLGIAMVDPWPDVRVWNAEGRALAEPIIEAGGAIEGRPELEAALARVNLLGERLNERVRAETERWLADGRLVGVVGGDHSTPFGAIQAIAAAHPGLGILHIDAHADLREAYEGFTWSHASIMHNVMTRVPDVARLVQVGIRDLCEAEVDAIKGSRGRIVTFYDTETKTRGFAGQGWAGQCERMVEALPEEVYISFDIDGLDPTLCPNTGTPVPGGLDYAQAVMLIGTVVRSGRRIVGFDLNEVAPGDDEWDANVGARILYKMIGWALASRE
ncbi:MAG: agmatinase family protein [Sandaracinaceae bacterium]|nr:agmatinase family protein [Sandaracinaceae bacterium]